MTSTNTLHGWVRRHTLLAALAAILIYVLLAVALGNVLSDLVSDDQEAAQFALGHLVPLPIGIAVLLLVVRWSGNGAAVWKEQPTPTLRPRRWYLIAIPVLAVGTYLVGATAIPWAERGVGIIALVAAGTLLVGLGEELAIRGVLLAALRERHGEFVTLFVTSLVFALIHIPGSIISGNPLLFIVIQVAGLMVVGGTYYWIRRITGRLWVAVLVHAFTDWVLYLSGDDVVPATSVPRGQSATDLITGNAEIVLWLFLALGVLSVIREDHRNRKPRQLEHDTVAPETDH